MVVSRTAIMLAVTCMFIVLPEIQSMAVTKIIGFTKPKHCFTQALPGKLYTSRAKWTLWWLPTWDIVPLSSTVSRAAGTLLEHVFDRPRPMSRQLLHS